MCIEHVLFWIVLTRAIVTKQSHNKLHNGRADSSLRSIVQLSRERTTPRISSWTSLKYYIDFSFIPKLVIFIYKQLKRPVAFSVVHTKCLLKNWFDLFCQFYLHPTRHQLLVHELLNNLIWTIEVRTCTSFHLCCTMLKVADLLSSANEKCELWSALQMNVILERGSSNDLLE